RGEWDCGSSCKFGFSSAGTAGGEFLLDFVHALLVQRVDEQRDGLEQSKQRRTERERERDAEQGPGGLGIRALHVAELCQKKRDEEAANQNARLDREERRRVDEARGAPS